MFTVSMIYYIEAASAWHLTKSWSELSLTQCGEVPSLTLARVRAKLNAEYISFALHSKKVDILTASDIGLGPYAVEESRPHPVLMLFDAVYRVTVT